MHRFIYHIASGEVFATGALLLLLAALLSLHQRSRVAQYAALFGILGAIAVAISSAPLSYWFYVPAGLILAAWLVTAWGTTASPARRRAAAALLVGIAVLGVALEMPYHIVPSIDVASASAITIFGDSLAAGVGNDADHTWPTLLARESGRPVHDHSRAGATAASALKQAKQIDIPDGVVLVEIGGNDLLGTTSADEFAADLDALLKHLSTPGRQIVMFELPLPPFANAFGRAQRQLATRYKVTLIPKRILAEVLAGHDATLDSIHLTPAGHRFLARQIQSILGLLAAGKPA